MLLAGALALGVHPAIVGLVAVAALGPWWFLAGVLCWSIWAAIRRRHERPGPDDEARFCEALAAELEAGASLRKAVADGASRAPRLALARASRLASAGRPAAEVSTALRQALPVNGRPAAAAYRVAAQTGARTADVFRSLAMRAAEAAEIERERSSLTTQARLSAWIVGGTPLVLVTLVAAFGGGASILQSGPVGRVVALLGLGLEAAGAGTVWLMMRRSVR